MSDIEKLEPLHKDGVDPWNNDDLFNLILEQRFKINEVIDGLKEKKQ